MHDVKALQKSRGEDNRYDGHRDSFLFAASTTAAAFFPLPLIVRLEPLHAPYAATSRRVTNNYNIMTQSCKNPMPCKFDNCDSDEQVTQPTSLASSAAPLDSYAAESGGRATLGVAATAMCMHIHHGTVSLTAANVSY